MSNVTRLPRAKKTWKSNYLPRVEREEAGRAIRKMCQHSANDNDASLSKIIKTALYRYQAPITICSITFLTLILSAAKVIS